MPDSQRRWAWPSRSFQKASFWSLCARPPRLPREPSKSDMQSTAASTCVAHGSIKHAALNTKTFPAFENAIMVPDFSQTHPLNAQQLPSSPTKRTGRLSVPQRLTMYVFIVKFLFHLSSKTQFFRFHFENVILDSKSRFKMAG